MIYGLSSLLMARELPKSTAYRALALLLSALLILCSCAAPAAIAHNELWVLKVRAIVPLSGPAVDRGLQGMDGTQIYESLINEHGELTIGDERYNIEIAGFQAVIVIKAVPGVKTLCWTGTKSGNQYLEGNFDKWDSAYEQLYAIRSVCVYYNQGTLDYIPTLLKMKELKVDVIYTQGSLTEVGFMAKKAMQKGYRPYIVI